MPIQSSDPQVQIFSLRLWPEELGDGQCEWRGQARHVSSGETRYFREWPVLIAFLQDVLPDLTNNLKETSQRPPEGAAS
jgi:hypothetical protein